MAVERTYTIPLRTSFRNTERYNKSKRATRAVREFLQKHMKSDDVRIGAALNEYIWSRGGRNPPARVSVVCRKDDDGVVFADLEGVELPSASA